MAETWFIGSTVADVIIHVDHLPKRTEDLFVTEQKMQLGGCAYNASCCFRHLDTPYHLVTPVGTGLYGRFVKEALEKQGIDILFTSQKANGCCYCLVEKDGERTFLSDHGAEYIFDKEMLMACRILPEDSVYVSGLEIEESSGQVIIDYLKNVRPKHILFAPGPRIGAIAKKKWEAMLQLHPILHLNEQEALLITRQSDVESAAKKLYQKTNAPVLITCGSRGAYGYDGSQCVMVPAKAVTHIQDTIGAGDSHAGMCLYGFHHHWPLHKILKNANQYSGAVVSIQGGQLSDEQFEKLLGKEIFR